jgi:predicted nucleic acid-binding protein
MVLLIDQIDILYHLYKNVIIPQTVANELRASESPSVVKSWIAKPPSWLKIQSVKSSKKIR